MKTPIEFVRRRFRMLIGLGQFERAEALIRLASGKLGAPSVTAALDRPADQTRITDWDTLGAHMEEGKRFVSAGADAEWRAIVLGLRNDTERAGLCVEVRFALSDEPRQRQSGSAGMSEWDVRQHEREKATQVSFPMPSQWHRVARRCALPG